MKYLSLPGLANPVSRLIYGASSAAMNGGRGADGALDAAFESGVNTFDTARGYGGSEENLGRWIKSRHIRGEVNIITKGCHHDSGGSRVNPEALAADLETSLKALGVDRIDIYLLHRDDAAEPVGPLIDALNQLRMEGKILCFGASNWTHGRIAEANAYARLTGQDGFSLSSVGLSVVRRVFDPWGGSIDISDNKSAQEWYAENNMPIFAYSSLARGFLVNGSGPAEYLCPENAERLRELKLEARSSGLTTAQAALRRLLEGRNTVCPIVGSASPEHIRSAAAVFDM